MAFERPHILQMHGYVPGEQVNAQSVVKLNTNENPYPPSDAVQRALDAIDISDLRRYPPATATPFREAAAAHLGVSADNIIPTNGGDELLRLVMTTFVDPMETIAVTAPTYSLYPVLAEIQNSSLIEIGLKEDWSMPDDFASKLNQVGAKLAILVNPHAPTGMCLSADYLASVASQFKGVLLVDEAYIDFVDPQLQHNAIPLIEEFQNIIFLRTMSKGYSLAGLRFGYGVGPQSLIHPMMYKTRDSYNTDHIAQKLATAALLTSVDAAKNWAKIRQSRELLAQQLKQLGIKSIPSQTNFLLCEIPESVGAQQLYEALKLRNILVRYFDQDRLRDKLRITIGTDAENAKLLQAVSELI